MAIGPGSLGNLDNIDIDLSNIDLSGIGLDSFDLPLPDEGIEAPPSTDELSLIHI